MDAALALAGLLMGAAATPHCALMCGAPCAALTAGSRRRTAGFHLGRLAGYTAGGALAATSIGALGAWSQWSPALRPLWTLLHVALLALGAWWLWTGRSAPWLQRRSMATVRFMPQPGVPGRAGRVGLAGLVWVAWPCGVLQGALLMSALANSPLGGAAVMAAFALGSAPALAFGPWLLARTHALVGAGLRARAGGLDLRISGLGLLLASGGALSHGLWQRIAAFCLA